MATSGTTTFNPDLGDLAEEAWERAGLELFNGYDLATTRRSLNFLMAEWANRGINLWTVEQGTQALTASDGTYDLPTDTVDLLDHVIRTGSGTSQTDYTIDRMAFPEYAAIANKLIEGRPTRIYVNRAQATPSIVLWPVPDSSASYTLVYWRMRRIYDAGAGGTYTQDVPFRFLPALVSGLAYHVALKRSTDIQRITGLKAIYDEQFQMAADEDRDRSSSRLVPWVRR